ncbi:hypothetical protein [Sutcliffiella horikoshii]|uniref:hypothetical protein n=1 Tax=Sutcliffiella horikoshii TaxID=79883 RepID=UPI001F17446C|nr:hypothetical protein [Sutcliffiella horikoshii]MCG1020779.1 hypothetical protein [Sutcliffiella horikoshii]
MNKRRSRKEIIDAISFNSIGHKIIYQEAISLTNLAEKMSISKPALSIHTRDEDIKYALEKIGIRSIKRGKVIYFDWHVQEEELEIEVINK